MRVPAKAIGLSEVLVERPLGWASRGRLLAYKMQEIRDFSLIQVSLAECL